MTREFHIYECVSCKHKEIYPMAAHLMFGDGKPGSFKCESCAESLSLVSTRLATLTLHPKTGRLCIEEDLKVEDYR